MPHPRPNIVFVLCDELRQAAVGCYRQDPVLTPNLDRFARESLVLTHCVSNQPVCTPYRGMLFTGLYPFRSGLFTNCNSKNDIHLPDNARCLGDVLKDNGYALGYIGKLHLHKPTDQCAKYGEGPRPDGVVWDAYTPPGPARHGFDFWYSYGCCDRHLNPHYWTGDAPVSSPVEPHEWSVKHETDVAIDFLKNPQGKHRDPNKPFFLLVSHNPPHMPFHEVPDEYRKPFKDKPIEELLTRGNVRYQDQQRARREAADYFAAVHGIDQQFQRILDTLDEQGLTDNTIVIFTADHGEMMRSYDRIGKNIWYDESLLVPWIMRWPGKITPRQDDLLFGAIDIYPTLLGLTGLADAGPDHLQGDDRSALLLGHRGPRPTSAFYLWPDARSQTDHGYIADARGVRTHHHTLVVARDATGHESTILHDNTTDPYQLTNVADQHPELVSHLRRELDTWLKRSNDPWCASPPAR